MGRKVKPWDAGITFKTILALLLAGVVVSIGSLAILLLLTPQLDSAGHFLKEKIMKKIVMSAILLVLFLVSIGGCWVGRDAGGRSGRSGGLDQSGSHDRGHGMEQRR